MNWRAPSSSRPQQGAASSSSTPRAMEKDRPLCKYFASNVCYKGDECQFSHERNARQDMVCQYYLAGNCSYGSRCRYDHVRPNVLASRRAIAAATNSESSNGKATAQTMGERSCAYNLQQQKTPLKLTPTLGEKMPLIPAGDSSGTNGTNAWSVPLKGVGPVPNTDFTSASFYAPQRVVQQEEGLASFEGCPPEAIPLCPYFEMGYCFNGEMCPFVHGQPCSMCNHNSLHPFNEQQRVEHHRQCLADHEAEMERAFAEQRSADKQCGVCFEVILEKGLRFGLLQNCKHCFCLECIRKWRQQNFVQQDMESRLVRSCPECRVHSDFIIPSSTWVEDKEEKSKLVDGYRANMKSKRCKYLQSGNVDDCPFGNKCFYKHQLPDGSVVMGDTPAELQRRKKYQLNLHQMIFGDANDESSDDLMSEVIQQLMANDHATTANTTP